MKFTKTLTLSFLLITTIISCSQKTESNGQLSATDFQTKLAASIDAQLIDVRTPAEFNEGHIKNAINIDINDAAFTAGIEQLDKSKPVFVYCLAGSRSANAAAQLRKSGFDQVYDMKGGMLAWRKASLPEEKPAATLAIPTGMNADDFKKTVTDDVLVLVDFNATWCGPCKKLAPILDELVQENPGKIKLVKIDVDQNQQLAAGMNISAIPVLQLYKGGNKVWEQLGLSSKETIAEAIKANQ